MCIRSQEIWCNSPSRYNFAVKPATNHPSSSYFTHTRDGPRNIQNDFRKLLCFSGIWPNTFSVESNRFTNLTTSPVKSVLFGVLSHRKKFININGLNHINFDFTDFGVWKNHTTNENKNEYHIFVFRVCYFIKNEPNAFYRRSAILFSFYHYKYKAFPVFTLALPRGLHLQSQFHYWSNNFSVSDDDTTSWATSSLVFLIASELV